jgi:hypothetical protein
MKSITKLSAVLLAAAVCAAWPAMAQTASTPAATNTAPATPKPARAPRFVGTIASVDSAAMTLTLKARGSNPETKVKVTSTTKIFKDGQPAQFSDAVEGLRVSGGGKKDADGVWTATTLRIITKAQAPKSPPAAGGTSEQKPQ